MLSPSTIRAKDSAPLQLSPAASAGAAMGMTFLAVLMSRDLLATSAPDNKAERPRRSATDPPPAPRGGPPPAPRRRGRRPRSRPPRRSPPETACAAPGGPAPRPSARRPGGLPRQYRRRPSRLSPQQPQVAEQRRHQ